MSVESLGPDSFGRGTKKRLPICFCLDASGSMHGERMQKLNEAMQIFVETIKQNSDAAASADVAVITFGGYIEIEKPFAQMSKQEIPVIESRQRSLTPMGEGILSALELLEIRKNGYRERGIKYFQPWLILITDGEPEGQGAQEAMEEAIGKLNALEMNNKLVVFNIGVGDDVNYSILSRTSLKRSEPIRVDSSNLKDLFEFIGSSSTAVIGGADVNTLYETPDTPDAEETEDDMIEEDGDFDITQWCI